MLGVNQENEKLMEEYERLASEVNHHGKFNLKIYLDYDALCNEKKMNVWNFR